MLRLLILFTGLCISWPLYGQLRIPVYCFPGQGADQRLFDSLQLDTLYELRVINYGTPEKGTDLRTFALRQIAAIDTTAPFVLLGVSLGGMICAELAETLHPQKTIIISSAKNRRELPLRYRFQRVVPLYRLFPGKVLLWGAKILQPRVEPDSKHHASTFQSMLNTKSPAYMKRTIGMIINWQRSSNTAQIYHIHGTLDHTLPLRYIKSPYTVLPKGSHMMTLTLGKEISDLINQILAQ